MKWVTVPETAMGRLIQRIDVVHRIKMLLSPGYRREDKRHKEEYLEFFIRLNEAIYNIKRNPEGENQ
jgi:hypothetical protein